MKTPGQIAAEIATRPAAEIENTDLQELLMEAIDIDRAQRHTPVVVVRDGCAYEGEGVEVIDLDFLTPRAVTCQSDFDQADIDRMLTLLDGDDFDEAAADVREWWAEREGTA